MLVCLLVGAGCHGSEPSERRSVVPSHDCLDAWNAPGNEANRAALLGSAFRVGQSSNWQAVADFGAGVKPHDGEARSFGCSFLFHSGTRFVSFSGTWQGQTIVWNPRQTLSGRWGAEQQQNARDDVQVTRGGGIRRRERHGRPATEPPQPRATPGPPPAWVETQRGSRWLAFSTFCLKDGCVDYRRAACAGDDRSPTLVVDRGELVRLHLEREQSPRLVLLTLRGRRDNANPIVVRARIDPVWHAAEEGAFEIVVLEGRIRTSSYVGCLRFAPSTVNAAPEPASARQCGQAATTDYWLDGTVGSTYHSSCYAWMLAHLPSRGQWARDPRPELKRRRNEALRREGSGR